MSLQILAQLDPKPRVTDKNNPEHLSAFVAVESGATINQFGIGLIDSDNKATWWALVTPHSLVTCWRAMHVLDLITDTRMHGIICHCYYAGQRELHSSDQTHIEKLSHLLPNIDEIRTELLQRKIPNDELDEMINRYAVANPLHRLNTHELEVELTVGIINRTPALQSVFEADAAERCQRELDEKISKQPIDPEHSFAQFCRDFRIQHLCDAPVGMYGFDWGHHNLDRLDESIIYNSLRFGHTEPIFVTQNDKRHDDFGATGHPVLRLTIDREEIEVVLREASYCKLDAKFYVHYHRLDDLDNRLKCTISFLRAQQPKMTAIYQVSYDKSSIVPITPPKPSWSYRFLRFLKLRP